MKARFHKSGPLWISRERSDLTYFLIANEMQNSLSSRCSRGLTAPPHKIVRAPRASKISTGYKCSVILVQHGIGATLYSSKTTCQSTKTEDSLSCGLYLFVQIWQQTHFIAKFVQFHTPSKSGKCENSTKNWPDYVKITPQNSTDYVKTAIFAVNNIRFATWKICLGER